MNTPARSAPRLYALVFVGGLAMCGMGTSQQACTPGQREGVRTVLDTAKAVCVIANAFLADAKVAEVCGITGPLLDPMRDLLVGTRAETAKAQAAGRAAALEEKTAGCVNPGERDAGVPVKGDSGAPR